MHLSLLRHNAMFRLRQMGAVFCAERRKLHPIEKVPLLNSRFYFVAVPTTHKQCAYIEGRFFRESYTSGGTILRAKSRSRPRARATLARYATSPPRGRAAYTRYQSMCRAAG